MKKVFKILFSLIFIFSLIVIIFVIRNIQIKSTEEIKNYLIEEEYNNINIDVTTNDINLYLSKNNENKVIYTENKGLSFDIKVENETLIIKENDIRPFYDRFLNFTTYKLDIYLSKESIKSLNIDGTTGDLEIDKGFIFENINIEMTTGDIEFSSNVTNNFDIKITTGDIDIENSELGNLSIESTTGDIDIENSNAESLDIKISTGKTKLQNLILLKDLKIEGATGDVILDSFDAENIYITLTTGNVKGTILSSKFFVGKSTTGKVRVPDTREGGECRITLTTGDIIITYKN